MYLINQAPTKTAGIEKGTNQKNIFQLICFRKTAIRDAELEKVPTVKENGTTEKVVKEEMQFAIREAMKSAEPEAIAFWKAVAPDGKEPPIEKVIAMIALNVNNRMYN